MRTNQIIYLVISVNRGASLSPYLNIDPTYLNQVKTVIFTQPLYFLSSKKTSVSALSPILPTLSCSALALTFLLLSK